MHTALSLILALGLTCCPAMAAAPAAAQQRFAGTREQVSEQLLRIRPSCPERVSVTVEGGLDETFCDRACALLNQQAGTWCHRYRTQGDKLDIDIRYTDFCLMLGVHEGRLPASRLSTTQKEAYDKACRIVAEAKAAHHDEEALAVALHDGIVLNSRYSDLVGADGHVSSLLLRGEGQCECYAGTYYLLARMAGLPCLYVEGQADGGGHVWNLLHLDGQWVHVDCTHDDPTPDRPGRVLHSYFGMDDATIARSHQWKRGDYPACPSDSFWYPRRHTERFATVSAMAAALIVRADEKGGQASLQGYVEELAQHPERASALLQAAVNRQRRSLSLEQDRDPVMAGFITLTCTDKPQKRKTP